MVQCFALGCKNRNDGNRNVRRLCFKAVPVNRKERALWAKILGREIEDGQKPSVCELHFDEDQKECIDGKRRLKKDAVPFQHPQLTMRKEENHISQTTNTGLKRSLPVPSDPLAKKMKIDENTRDAISFGLHPGEAALQPTGIVTQYIADRLTTTLTVLLEPPSGETPCGATEEIDEGINGQPHQKRAIPEEESMYVKEDDESGDHSRDSLVVILDVMLPSAQSEELRKTAVMPSLGFRDHSVRPETPVGDTEGRDELINGQGYQMGALPARESMYVKKDDGTGDYNVPTSGTEWDITKNPLNQFNLLNRNNNHDFSHDLQDVSEKTTNVDQNLTPDIDKAAILIVNEKTDLQPPDSDPNTSMVDEPIILMVDQNDVIQPPD